MEYVYHNKEKLEEWGKSSRTFIKEDHTWKKVVMDLESLLSSINAR
jgi:hypothetical protein